MRSLDNLHQPLEWLWQPRHFMGSWLFYGLQFVCPLLVFSVGILQCPTLVVKEQQWGRGGAWCPWSRGQLAEIFPDSFAGILSQYIQRDPLAGPVRQLSRSISS